jgi:hypothetical protein
MRAERHGALEIDLKNGRTLEGTQRFRACR